MRNFILSPFDCTCCLLYIKSLSLKDTLWLSGKMCNDIEQARFSIQTEFGFQLSTLYECVLLSTLDFVNKVCFLLIHCFKL